MTTNDDRAVATPEVVPAPRTDGSAAAAAARLLEVAARNADELLADAKAEADQLTRSARVEADRLVAAARADAEQVRTELEQERAHHSAEIARLAQVEQEHRERVRRHLTDMLAQVEAPPS
jgi:cell division septum initiation protein DivIVA